ncbi:MAG: LytTR family transcriptional regulator DNA-binding domain-containing protein [Bacteroidales bacterium]|nr:LytTR family transcriptional regulator DNA-binding domain-containing protein [Candidatus Minthousia equi]MDO4957130.1 LytTR family transcriptional regulator DNA-binding domain-containing protein [Bacteroidales bacterium]
MGKLYFNTRDELACIEPDLVAVVQANGNYSRVVYITKKEIELTCGISKLEEALKSANGKKNRFIRLGRSYIINHSYLQKIELLKQRLVLGDCNANEIRLVLPKNILKSYKNAVVTHIKSKEEKHGSKD